MRLRAPRHTKSSGAPVRSQHLRQPRAGWRGSQNRWPLSSARPSGLSDVLVPAAAAAILGGVSLVGGTGTPLGIAAGVLTLTVLRSGLNAIAAPPFAHDLATGLILLVVAISDASFLWHRLIALKCTRSPIFWLGCCHTKTANDR